MKLCFLWPDCVSISITSRIFLSLIGLLGNKSNVLLSGLRLQSDLKFIKTLLSSKNPHSTSPGLTDEVQGFKLHIP